MSKIERKTILDGRPVFGFSDDPYFASVENYAGDAVMGDYYRLVRALLPRRFFDIGANIGVTALAAQALSPGVEVIALEPSGRAFSCLERTFEENKIQGHAIFACAGESEGSTTFEEAEFLAGSHRGPGGPSVPMTTLENLAVRFGAPDFIKIDVEGFELDVLKGAGPTIEKASPVLFMEVNAFTLAAYGRISPITLLEYVGEHYGGFFFEDRGGVLRFAQSKDDVLGFLHFVMVEAGCMWDIIFSPSEEGRERIRVAARSMANEAAKAAR